MNDDNNHPAIETDDAVHEQQIEHRIDRRDFLRIVGAAGGLSLVGSRTALPVAAAPAWEQQADQRIEQHRKGDIEIVVTDQNGNPVPNASVSLAMREHDFAFGTAVNANVLVYGTDTYGQQLDSGDVQKYRRVTRELFNTAVLGNSHKWRFWENDQERADQATQWLLDNGLDVRGHTCIWGRTGVAAIPDDILTAVENRNARHIRERSHQHIEDIITHYGTDIMEWDVVNEAIHVHHIQKGVYGDTINSDEPWTGEVVPWRSQLLAEWYKTAEAAAPDGVGIAVNDFNVISNKWDYTEDWYPSEINHLLDSGVDLDGIGFQSHWKVTDSEDGTISPSRMLELLNLYADILPHLRITEFDYAQSQGWDDHAQADFFYQYLKTTFSHPAVEQFLIWGFWDQIHWSDPPQAPLFDRNFNRKPGYDVWMNLVFDQWWTDKSGTTDDSGTYATDAFLGEHEITVEIGTESVTKRVSLTDLNGTTTVTVPVTNSGSGTDLAPIDGAMPTDPDGDGSYEDVNGNGKIDFDDMVTYFEHMDEAVMDNPAYDYNANGKIDYNDLVTLFQELS
jgi:GH35 family endo-1,4-beta-xylanase